MDRNVSKQASKERKKEGSEKGNRKEGHSKMENVIDLIRNVAEEFCDFLF